MKYGGFIPLSETDVLEHLKKKGNSDPGNRLVCTQTHLISLNLLQHSTRTVL